MQLLHARLASATALAAVLAIAACGRQQAPTSDLERDLQRAGSSMELLPAGAHSDVMSAIEQVPASMPRTAQRAPRRSPPPRRQSQVARAPSHEAVAPSPATPAPTTGRATQEPPPGGFKTVREIIRNAPFPINP